MKKDGPNSKGSNVMPPYQTIIYEKSNCIAYITLNRPEALNVYNIQMRDELYQILDAIKEDDEVKVVILKGTGDKSFCAGADLTEFLTAPTPVTARQVRWERDLWGLLLSIPQPIIGVLHGYVFGSGLEMALCCDLRIASDDAKFGLPESGLGIIPAAGATQTLPRTIGRGKALEMLLTTRWIDANEAYKTGLVNRIVPLAELIPLSQEVAGKIISLGQLAVKNAKRAIVEGLDLPLPEGLDLEQRLFQSLA
ncbi:enoyl-CoA hydratase/isomerase family protein [Chloroflexota bacterium]